MHATLPIPLHSITDDARPLGRVDHALADLLGGPVSVVLNDDTSPVSLANLVALAGFVDGREPFAVTKRLDRVREDAVLLPAGVEPIHVVVAMHGTLRVARGDGWSISAWRYHEGGSVQVTARSEELAAEIVAAATDGAEAPETTDENAVDVGFWRHSGHGPVRTVRAITAAPWDDIRPNYSGAVASAFDRLFALEAPPASGRLLLLHGPPGTGKTTAIRALARRWRPWCRVEVVIDPERLLGDPGYLLHVAVEAGDDDDERWLLLVLEDCDELIRHDAKAGTGQGLSRLLNVTDGMLGQGQRLIVGLSTNEELDRLHPAVVRPGRCLARVFVGPLDRNESRAWLGGDADRVTVPSTGATLAELCELRGDLDQVRLLEPDTPAGQYL